MKFDAVVLMKHIIQFELTSELRSVVYGFIDPFKTVCDLYPYQKYKGQEAMCKQFGILGGFDSQEHNALSDCNELRRLCKKLFEEFTKKQSKTTFRAFWAKHYANLDTTLVQIAREPSDSRLIHFS